jgi:hypothetical protein
LSSDEEKIILDAIDKYWEEFNAMIDDIFAGKKIHIKQLGTKEQ